MSGSVLYDVPGPRAVVRNRIIGAVTILVVLLFLGWVVWRFYDTGQLSPEKWELFSYSAIWMLFLEATWNTLAAFGVAAVGAIILGFILALGRMSEHAWLRVLGHAIGLRKAGVMRLVLLPQAIRAMLPVIISQLVVTLKDTALGFIITYPELLYLVKLLGSQALYNSPLIPSAIIGGSIYVALCLALSYIAYLVERRTRRSPKVTAVAAANQPGQGGTDTELIVAQSDARTGGGA